MGIFHVNIANWESYHIGANWPYQKILTKDMANEMASEVYLEAYQTFMMKF